MFLKYINDTQFGLAGGFEIKLAVGRFTDIFVSLIGERNLSTFSDDKESIRSYYGAAIRSGVLFQDILKGRDPHARASP